MITSMRARGANEKIVLGLIGAGGRGSGVARGFAGLDNVEFKYVCEVNDLRGHGFAKEMNDFVMTMDCTDCIAYNKKSSTAIRTGDRFPYWPQNATRIEIYGTKRMMYLGRHGGGWQVMAQDAKVVDFEYGNDPNPPHRKNFIDCIRSRKDPNGVVEQGHLSACLVHLANLSLRVGNKQLHFDAQRERFTNSDRANAMLKRPGRKHYRIPEKV